jgi:trimeric autotransporter adhesin
VSQASPGIFTLNQSGKGPGAVVNQDGSVNGPGHPASSGSVVLILGTGEGQTDPPGRDGRIATNGELRLPLLPVSVSIGGRSAEVVYAGSLAGQVAGLFHVNARVPAGLAPGDALPVTVHVGNTSSQAGVTVAVR